MSSCAKLIKLDKLSADPNIFNECQDEKRFNGWPVPKCLYDRKIQACLPSIGGATKPPGKGVLLTWPDVWPLGGSYMTATNAENGEQARAKRRILAMRQVSKRAAAL